LAAAPAKAAQEDIAHRTGIAATVNDDAITFSDIRNRLDLYLAGNPETPPPEIRRKLEKQVLDKLIDEKLQLQEAKKDGITVTDDDIKRGMEQIARQNKLSPAEFQDRIDRTGVKRSTLTEQIRAEIAWSQVVRRKLRPEVNVSESEIDSAMAQMSHGKGKTEYRVAEILLTIPSAEMEDTVRHDADKIIEDVQKGGSFPSAARQYSKAPGAAQGGDLGWIRQGMLNEKLEEALAKMHPGQISAPIRTDKGYHILFLRDVHVAGAATPPKAATPAPAAAPPPPKAETPGPEVTLHLRQITIPISPTDPEPVIAAKMNRAATLKAEISGCEQMEKRAKDFISPGTADLGSGPLSSLPEPVRKAVADLPVGELSAPIRGDNGVAVMMVCERSSPPAEEAAAAPPPPPAPAPQPPAQAPPTAAEAPPEEASRDQVANQIGMKRLDQMQERYLRDLRATAFIDKRL
ncbi:MAG: hypothetical protein EPN97_06390, partial [Alphaproteobacteria bacterium]